MCRMSCSIVFMHACYESYIDIMIYSTAVIFTSPIPVQRHSKPSNDSNDRPIRNYRRHDTADPTLLQAETLPFLIQPHNVSPSPSIPSSPLPKPTKPTHSNTNINPSTHITPASPHLTLTKPSLSPFHPPIHPLPHEPTPPSLPSSTKIIRCKVLPSSVQTRRLMTSEIPNQRL